MNKTFTAHFDGQFIVPDEPVELPVGQPLRVHLEIAAEARPRFADFLDFAVDSPDIPSDLAYQLDHYLYGTPKK